jgi:hypothetical protein
VDHVFLKHNYTKKSLPSMLRAWTHRPSAAMISFLCLGCRLGLQKGILSMTKGPPRRVCILGGGEPEGSFATAFFSSTATRLPRALSVAPGVIRELLRNPQYLRSPSCIVRMVHEMLRYWPPLRCIRRVLRPQPWQTVNLFSYIPWDENKIMNTIQKELNWKQYHYSATPWRSDCKINLLKNELYRKTLGFTKNDEILSGMVRRGQITRAAALARATKENVIPEAFLREFFATLGLSYEAWAARNPGTPGDNCRKLSTNDPGSQTK